MRVMQRRVRRALDTYGLLLESDARLPSVARLVASAPIRGSWWAHPMGGAIYAVSGWLATRDNVLVCKLVSGKVTYVHGRLWPVMFAVGTARERWQMQTLSRLALSLLKTVQRDGELYTADIPRTRGAQNPSPAQAARELEQTLLVHAAQVHTEKGFHAKHLESWEHWARRVGFQPRPLTAARARTNLERVLSSLNRRFDASARLPWSEKSLRKVRLLVASLAERSVSADIETDCTS